MTGSAASPTLVKMLDDDFEAKTLFAAVSRLAEAWRLRYRQEMARRGYPWHLSAVGDLLDHLPPEGIAQAALTARTGLTKQAVQQSLDQLEKHGVIRREPDPADKRLKHIVVTELGRKNLADRAAVLAEFEARGRDLLGKKAARKLRKSLRELA